MNDDDLLDAIGEAYNDFYDDPRGIHYVEIADRFDTDGLAEADLLADVIDMACRDRKNGLDRKSADEVLRTIEGWSQ